MSLRINFTPLISPLAGVSTVDLEPVPPTVGEVLETLTRLYPGLKDELFDEEQRLDYLYQVTLNGKKLDRARTMEEPVKDGDRLQFLAVLSGG